MIVSRKGEKYLVRGTKQYAMEKLYYFSVKTIGATPTIVQIGNSTSNFCNKCRVTGTRKHKINNGNHSRLSFLCRVIIK